MRATEVMMLIVQKPSPRTLLAMLDTNCENKRNDSTSCLNNSFSDLQTGFGHLGKKLVLKKLI